MSFDPITIGDFQVGPGSAPLLIAGPCVLEDIETALEIAAFMKAASERHGFRYVFKASYDKANRTSITSYRGPGIEKGLEMLDTVRDRYKVPVISDVHEPSQVRQAAEVLDVLQIPAFLCRQTDLLVAAAESGLVVNIKKGQFMAPWDMRHAVGKVRESENHRIILTERGACFGYNNLVVDMRSIKIMQGLGCPVVFDATHSVQLPGGGDGCSAGQREFVAPLARAAAAAGADGFFMEVHPEPDRALCDGPNSLDLQGADALLGQIAAIRSALSIQSTDKPEVPQS